MCITIVLEDRGGNLEYYNFNLKKEFKEAQRFYFQNQYEVFEVRTNENNGYYDLVDEKIFFKGIKKI